MSPHANRGTRVVFHTDILARLILANIPVAALSFALLAGFHWRGATTRGAWASVVVGVVWGAGSYVLVGEAGGYTWTWAMYGIPLIFLTGIGTSFFDRMRQRGGRGGNPMTKAASVPRNNVRSASW